MQQAPLRWFAAAHTGSNAGSSRFLPLMFEPIMRAAAARAFDIARASSVGRGASGACIGRVAMPYEAIADDRRDELGDLVVLDRATAAVMPASWS